MSATARVLRRVRNAAPVSYAPSSGQPIFGPARPTGLTAYGTVSTLFSIVRRLYTSVAAVEWYLCEVPLTTRARAAYDIENPREIASHPALDVWNKPNGHMTQRELVETWLQHSELAGDGFLVIEGIEDVGFPLELWPLRPDRMAAVPSDEDFLAGWVFTDAAGHQVAFDDRDVLQMKHGPHPTDPYRGMGPVATLLNVLGSTAAAQMWNLMFFENGATPRGAWSLPGAVDDIEFEDFQRRLREQHRGVRNAHRDIVVDNGAKYEAIQVNAKDMQLVEQFGINRDIILEAYGMSKTMIGAAESETNRATAETAEYVFAKYQLVERLDRIKDILNTRFLPLYGVSARGVEFRYRNPVPADKEADRAERDSRVNGAVALKDAGWDPADALSSMGLPPMAYVGTDPQEVPS